MKRPRRPVKRKAVKSAPKRVRNSARNLPIAPSVPWTEEEASIFERLEAPDKLSYQWAPHEEAFRMQIKGWVQVPYARHAHAMPPSANFDGYIVYRGMALFQMERDLVRALLDSAQKKAQSMARNSGSEALELIAGYTDPRRIGLSFPILSPSFMVDQEYDLVPNEGQKVIDISIKFAAPWNWQDAASALGLDLSEYVRRRLLMTGKFLGPGEDGTYTTLEVTTKKAED